MKRRERQTTYSNNAIILLIIDNNTIYFSPLSLSWLKRSNIHSSYLEDYHPSDLLVVDDDNDDDVCGCRPAQQRSASLIDRFFDREVIIIDKLIKYNSFVQRKIVHGRLFFPPFLSANKTNHRENSLPSVTNVMHLAVFNHPFLPFSFVPFEKPTATSQKKSS